MRSSQVSSSEAREQSLQRRPGVGQSTETRRESDGVFSLIAALLLGLVCGVIARTLVPNDVFSNMSGPKSWLVSTALGLAGAVIVVAGASFILRRTKLAS